MKKHLTHFVVMSITILLVLAVAAPAFAGANLDAVRDRKWYPMVPLADSHTALFPDATTSYGATYRAYPDPEDLDGTDYLQVVVLVNGVAYRYVDVPWSQVTIVEGSKASAPKAKFFGSSTSTPRCTLVVPVGTDIGSYWLPQ